MLIPTPLPPSQQHKQPTSGRKQGMWVKKVLEGPKPAPPSLSNKMFTILQKDLSQVC